MTGDIAVEILLGDTMNSAYVTTRHLILEKKMFSLDIEAVLVHSKS